MTGQRGGGWEAALGGVWRLVGLWTGCRVKEEAHPSWTAAAESNGALGYAGAGANGVSVGPSDTSHGPYGQMAEAGFSSTVELQFALPRG